MNHYHDPGDMGRLKELRRAAPREFDAWLKLDEVVGIEDGAIPRRYRELMAVACAHLTRCVYCLEDHVRAANSLGVTESEIAEAAMIAAALAAGAAGAHGAMALKFFDRAGVDPD